MKAWIAVASLLLSAGCTTTIEKPAYLVGTWGGPHAGYRTVPDHQPGELLRSS